MATFEITKRYEKNGSQRYFILTEIMTDSGRNLSVEIEEGRQFGSNAELKDYLSSVFDIPYLEVNLLEMDYSSRDSGMQEPEGIPAPLRDNYQPVYALPGSDNNFVGDEWKYLK